MQTVLYVLYVYNPIAVHRTESEKSSSTSRISWPRLGQYCSFGTPSAIIANAPPPFPRKPKAYILNPKRKPISTSIPSITFLPSHREVQEQKRGLINSSL